jgi:hypothetical protein
VYERYLTLLKTDNNARIEHVIAEPNFQEMLVNMPNVQLRMIEEAVLVKINQQLMLNEAQSPPQESA